MPNKIEYISLQEASTLCNYSQEYLSLRARQGKLKSIKNGRNWVTTAEWLENYIKHAEDVKLAMQTAKEKKPEKSLESNKIKVRVVSGPKKMSVPENLPVENNFQFKKKENKVLPSSVLMSAAFLILFLPSVIIGRNSIVGSVKDFGRASEIVGETGDYFMGDLGLSVQQTAFDAKSIVFSTPANMSAKFSQASIAVATGDDSNNPIFKFLNLFNRKNSRKDQSQLTNGVAQVDKIEMRDQVTGEIYCTWLEDGWMVKVKSSCKDVTQTEISNALK